MLPLLVAALGILFSIVGVGLTIIAIVLVLGLLWVVVSGAFLGGRRGRDDWDE